MEKHVDHIRINIPTEPVMRGSEESSHPLRSRGQTFKEYSTFVVQILVDYRDSNLSPVQA